MGICKEIKEITKIYTPDQGCTCPIEVLLHDGSKAIFKYPNNPEGSIVLLNEYLAYSIGHAINLTIPKFGMAQVTEATVLKNELNTVCSIEKFAGYGFFSEYIPRTAPASHGLVATATNLNECCKAILFDMVIKNIDRYENNIRVSLSSDDGRLYFIDHSHAFGDPSWTPRDLVIGDTASPYVWQENSACYLMLRNAGAPYTEHNFLSAAQQIQDMLTNDITNNIFECLPRELIDRFEQSDLNHAKAYIQYRINNIDKICAMIKREGGF